jgi:hypothetical protein
VVFIVGDNVGWGDIGWGDIGCYGGLAPTPRIDALAAHGMRFKNYNVEAQCTPTRSAPCPIEPPRKAIHCGQVKCAHGGEAASWFSGMRANSRPDRRSG